MEESSLKQFMSGQLHKEIINLSFIRVYPKNRATPRGWDHTFVCRWSSTNTSSRSTQWWIDAPLNLVKYHLSCLFWSSVFPMLWFNCKHSSSFYLHRFWYSGETKCYLKTKAQLLIFSQNSRKMLFSSMKFFTEDLLTSGLTKSFHVVAWMMYNCFGMSLRHDSCMWIFPSSLFGAWLVMPFSLPMRCLCEK